MASGNRQPPKGRAPNAGAGKREWRTPIPHLSLLDRKVGQGLIVEEEISTTYETNSDGNTNELSDYYSPSLNFQ